MNDTPPPLTPIKRHIAEPTTGPTTAMRGNTLKPTTKRIIRCTEKSKKMVTLSQMHKETQQRLTAIEEHTQIMARALQSIGNDINRFVNHVVERE